MRLNLFAPAKINLHLHVLGRRPDGYHELATLMQPLSLGDELIIDDQADEIIFTCNEPALQRGNLVEKAARLWFEAAGLKPRVALHLNKMVPVAAGLGGGSSDAAAALIGLNAINGALLPPERLVELASSLGADVPFFLANVTGWCTGIGEKVEPWPDFPLLDYVLVNPGFPVSTAQIYAEWDLAWTNQSVVNTIYRPPKAANDLDGLLRNDLELVTQKAFPQVEDLRKALREEGAMGALMSGSGPTVFGVFPDAGTAVTAAERLSIHHDWWVRACRGYGQAEGERG
jgi:4-diphosphocytidyl-2-C-methyl-D-erythritol kinase